MIRRIEYFFNFEDITSGLHAAAAPTLGFHNLTLNGQKLKIQEPSDTSSSALIGYAIFVTRSNYMPTVWAVKYSNPLYFGAENSSNWRLLEIFQVPKLTCKMNILFMIKDNKRYI